MSDATSGGDDDQPYIRFEHPSGKGVTTMNFGTFNVHDDGTATLELADGSAEVHLSRETEWVVGPRHLLEGMEP